MDETVSRLFYYLLQNAAWVFIYVVAFKKANKLKFFQKMVHIIALTCTQEICRLAVGPVIVQLLMLAVFYTFVRIEAPKASKQLLTEVTFTYALRELFRLFCSLMSTFLCMLLFETKSWTAIVSIHSMLMIVICGLYFLLFRQGKLLKLGEKYSIGIFATIFILMLAALGKMQAP